MMYQQHSLDVFQDYLKEYTKGWFSSVRLIYSHSILHNIISNRTGVIAHFFYHTNLLNFYVIISNNKMEMFCF